MNHFMLDIETLSTKPNAVVTSVGIVEFNHTGVVERFEKHLPIGPQIKKGRDISDGTLMFWLQQSEEARQQLVTGQNDLTKKDSVKQGLVEVMEFIGNNPAGLWGNGAAFDNVILTDLITNFGGQTLWGFWVDRCYRTVKQFHPNTPLKRIGTYHRAVDDAESQAWHLIALNEESGGTYL